MKTAKYNLLLLIKLISNSYLNLGNFKMQPEFCEKYADRRTVNMCCRWHVILNLFVQFTMKSPFNYDTLLSLH